MKTASKTLAVVVLLYLATGVLDVFAALSASGLVRIAAFVYIGCFLLAIVGVAGAFTSRLGVFRISCLWAIGLPCLFYATQKVVVQFPTFLNVPVSFGSTYSSGEFTKFGVDVIPGAIFIAVWIVSKKQSPVPKT